MFADSVIHILSLSDIQKFFYVNSVCAYIVIASIYGVNATLIGECVKVELHPKSVKFKRICLHNLNICAGFGGLKY